MRLADLTRRALLHSLALPLVLPLALPTALHAADFVDPLFGRLKCKYILFRPGETTFEAADIVDSNPINKQSSDRGLTPRGREQVQRSIDDLRARGFESVNAIYYDNGARASQTAEMIASAFDTPRAQVEPEFRWLEGRGWGALEGTELRAARAKLLALDALDILNTPEPTDDATPPDSVNDVFVRLRNCIGALENKYPGQEFLIVGGDANVLSIFAAAACGWDLREHGRFTLRPGEFFVLKELQEQVRNGSFVPMALNEPTARDIAEGRQALIDIGPKIFGETGAGSEILDMRR